MPYSDNVVITALTVIFLLVIALIFRKPISSAKKFKISLTGIEFEASGDEFVQLFKKTYLSVLKEGHIDFFCELGNTKTVPVIREVLPDFNRGSKEWLESDKGMKTIGMLRALRGLGLIKPKGGGKWESDSKIIITELGREFKSHIKG